MKMSDNNEYHHKKGMRYPPLNDLVSRAHNKYELVLAAAKRAREIVDGKEPLIPYEVNNPISIATDEIEYDYVKLKNPKLDDEKWSLNPNSLILIDRKASQMVEIDENEENPLVEIEDS